MNIGIFATCWLEFVKSYDFQDLPKNLVKKAITITLDREIACVCVCTHADIATKLWLTLHVQSA